MDNDISIIRTSDHTVISTVSVGNFPWSISTLPSDEFVYVINKIDNNISSMDDWKVFEFHFEKAHEKFLQKLINKYPQLSHSNLRLCAYLRMNLTSKEIAALLRISYRGVENHRYRLRKKLLLKKEVNLTDFILSL